MSETSWEVENLTERKYSHTHVYFLLNVVIIYPLSAMTLFWANCLTPIQILVRSEFYHLSFDHNIGAFLDIFVFKCLPGLAPFAGGYEICPANLNSS